MCGVREQRRISDRQTEDLSGFGVVKHILLLSRVCVSACVCVCMCECVRACVKFLCVLCMHINICNGLNPDLILSLIDSWQIYVV